MKANFKFYNLCGRVYGGGPVIFTPDGNSLLTAVGNRVCVFDLQKNVSRTLDFQHRSNIDDMALSPDGNLLVVSGNNLITFVSMLKGVVISAFSPFGRVFRVKFSPDGAYICLSMRNVLDILKTPPLKRQYRPVSVHTRINRHADVTPSVDWSLDSQYVLYGGREGVCYISSAHDLEQQDIAMFSGGSSVILCTFVNKDQTVYILGEDRVLTIYDRSEQGTWEFRSKFTSEHSAHVLVAKYHHRSNLLLMVHRDGVFSLYEMPDFRLIQQLKVTNSRVQGIGLSPSGDWLAFGSISGQLLVWEWQSERYILKQQGHITIRSLSYSPEGLYIATGGSDGKIKLWNSRSGYCFVTFDDHEGAVTGVEYSSKGQVIVSSSLDGTVRAFDVLRYKNFRVLTSPTLTQFSCVAIDPSGEVVCAGTQDDFTIIAWSLQTGAILDVLAGHEGPVTCLAFSPTLPVLATGSWDRSVRLWNIYEGSKMHRELLMHDSEVLSLAFRSDGKEICSSDLSGKLYFWTTFDAALVGTIEGKSDLTVSSTKFDSVGKVSMEAFSTVCYSGDGRFVIAGGKSNYICLYEVSQRILVKKWKTTDSTFFDGTISFSNKKAFTQNLDLKGRLPALANRDKLPGTENARLKDRRMEIYSIRFSPSGRQFACSSIEGMLIYSLDENVLFDPYQLHISITPENILQCLDDKQFIKALVMSLRLNESKYVKHVFFSIPVEFISPICSQIHPALLNRLLGFIADFMADMPHLEFMLIWIKQLILFHGQYIKDNLPMVFTTFRNLQKNIMVHRDDLLKIVQRNVYSLQYLSSLSRFEKISVENE